MDRPDSCFWMHWMLELMVSFLVKNSGVVTEDFAFTYYILTMLLGGETQIGWGGVSDIFA